jgi:hypothetical protein
MWKMVRSTSVACGVGLKRDELGCPRSLSLLRLVGSGLLVAGGNSSRPAEQLLSFLMRLLQDNTTLEDSTKHDRAILTI